MVMIYADVAICLWLIAYSTAPTLRIIQFLMSLRREPILVFDMAESYLEGVILGPFPISCVLLSHPFWIGMKYLLVIAALT